MQVLGAAAVALLLGAGGIFGLIGGWGLVRLPDPMSRLHAPSLSAALGVGAVLIASLVWFPGHEGRMSWHELLITLFLLLTTPVTANMLAKANMHLGLRPGDLPVPPGGVTWSTFGPPDRPEDEPGEDGAGPPREGAAGSGREGG
jgi:multicomponent K+:H+ antiporter subunit G